MATANIFSKYTEDVNGTVIGGFSRRVVLVAPNGNIQRDKSIAIEDDPIVWAKEELEKIKNQACGDGKPLSFHTIVYESIYGKGDWIVRVYD